MKLTISARNISFISNDSRREGPFPAGVRVGAREMAYGRSQRLPRKPAAVRRLAGGAGTSGNASRAPVNGALNSGTGGGATRSAAAASPPPTYRRPPTAPECTMHRIFVYPGSRQAPASVSHFFFSTS